MIIKLILIAIFAITFILVLISLYKEIKKEINRTDLSKPHDHLASQNILKEGRKSLGELALAKSEA